MDVYSCHFLPDHVQFTLIHGPNIPGSYAILFLIALDFTFITRHIHNGVEQLVVVLHSSPVAYWTPSELGAYILVSYLFAFLCSSWGSHSKYTGVVCYSLLQWITFWSELSTMTCPSWVALLSMAHSFLELCKPLHHNTVIHEGDRYVNASLNV